MRATRCIICGEEVALLEATPENSGMAEDEMKKHLKTIHTEEEIMRFTSVNAAEHRTFRLVEEGVTVTPR